MKKIILLSLIISLLVTSCNEKEICLEQYKFLQKDSCNIIVTENITKNTSIKINYLKIKGIDIKTQKSKVFETSPRTWNALAEYINIGDTVVKKNGEAIMYVYKRDSIVEMNEVDICNQDFDWENLIRIKLRNNE